MGGLEFLPLVGVGILVGMFGALLGIGGGVFLVPVLALFFDVPMHMAIGAGLIAVIATSCAASSVYVARGLANVSLALILEMATALGAVTGGIVAGLVSGRALSFLFGIMMLYVTYHMARGGWKGGLSVAESVEWTGNRRSYSLGMAVSYLAGNISGLLGIGGGVIKLPAMYLIMGVPFREAAATSNLMVGATAAASAFVYYARGDVDLTVAGPAALGTFLGGLVGARLLVRFRVRHLTLLFSLVMLYFALQMVSNGLGLSLL